MFVHAFKPGVPAEVDDPWAGRCTPDENALFRLLARAVMASSACSARVAKCHGVTLFGERVALVTQAHEGTLETALAGRGGEGAVLRSAAGERGCACCQQGRCIATCASLDWNRHAHATSCMHARLWSCCPVNSERVAVGPL